MCGIVGITVNPTQKNLALPVVLEGLQRLEYRGYDSCGVAFLHQDSSNDSLTLTRRRSTGRMSSLFAECQNDASQIAIGHTRWATHGKPSTDNAHPHFSQNRFALVHNGIIENYVDLREKLITQGFTFLSQTDTEVIVHWIAYEAQRGDGLLAAVQRTCLQLVGAYSIAVIDQQQPKLLVGARNGSPLVVGYHDDGFCLASDVLALSGAITSFAYLEEGDVVAMTPDSLQIYARHVDSFLPCERAIQHNIAVVTSTELGPYRHYMQKEIFEQPRAIADTLQSIDEISPTLFGEIAAEKFRQIKQVHIIACGTSYYAGLVAQYWIESICRLPVKVEIASEFRYRTPVLIDHTLLVCISQSGETADLLSALRFAKTINQGLTSLAICNVASSALVRETECRFITHAGVEIGVASTKAFTTQLVALYLLALTLKKSQQVQAADDFFTTALAALRHLPIAAAQVLALEPAIMAWAQQFSAHHNALFLGRGGHYPIALEGALKLKEISYIHAEGYPAGELKHGPLALVSSEMPVVVVAPNNQLLEKLHSNMQEVKARGGQLFVFADDDANIKNEDGLRVICLPEHYGDLSPLLHVIPLQLLAYHTAVIRGTDVDKPRNLAKSVTVE